MAGVSRPSATSSVPIPELGQPLQSCLLTRLPTPTHRIPDATLVQQSMDVRQTVRPVPDGPAEVIHTGKGCDPADPPSYSERG